MEDPEEVIKKIGRRIAELRAECGLTQADVAESLETTTSNYQRIEHGLQNLTVRTMVRIAGVLGVSVASLLEKPEARVAKRGRPKQRA